jgi:uncharacterized protein (DUF169 family)
MLRHLPGLMDKGRPISILFTRESGEDSALLYCEIVQKARFGESFIIKTQGCKVGAYVLGDIETSPEDYYFGSRRYRNRDAAKRAVSGLSRISIGERSIKITPYSGEYFDILILFLKPERAMRLVQAYTYTRGDPVEFRTGGIASVCSECTASPFQEKTGISCGCKGSRKHSMYEDSELIIGIQFKIAGEIDEALGKIPRTFE